MCEIKMYNKIIACRALHMQHDDGLFSWAPGWNMLFKRMRSTVHCSRSFQRHVIESADSIRRCSLHPIQLRRTYWILLLSSSIPDSPSSPQIPPDPMAHHHSSAGFLLICCPSGPSSPPAHLHYSSRRLLTTCLRPMACLAPESEVPVIEF